MMDLIGLQHADGSWDLDEALAEAIGGGDFHAMESALGSQARDHDARRAWATALALAWLTTRVDDVRTEWQLIAEKGKRWLAKTAVRPSGAGDWMEHATRWQEATRAS